MDRSRLIRIANSYYNMGLARAKERNLTGAISCLEKALYFNKKHIQARNLLGLIYYEIGEVAEALTQWVISGNLSAENNIAFKYIEHLQRREAELAKYADDIKKYNQALMNAGSENKDLAIMMLGGIVDFSKNYIRANLLLSLLYIDKEEYINAGRYLLNVLKVDKHNTLALRYLQIVKEETGKAESERRKDESLFLQKKSSDDSVIIPSGYKEGLGWQTAVNIAIGLLIGAASMLFIYMPTRTAQLRDEHKKELISVHEKLNTANLKAEELSAAADNLQIEIDRLSESVNTVDESTTYKLTQYQLLAGMIDAYRSQDYGEAASLYVMIDPNELIDIDDGSGVSVKYIYNEVAERMAKDGYELLISLGDASYSARDYRSAIEYYDKSLGLKPDHPMTIYKKGLAYKQMGDTSTANSLFGEVITAYPGSDVADLAKTERGY